MDRLCHEQHSAVHSMDLQVMSRFVTIGYGGWGGVGLIMGRSDTSCKLSISETAGAYGYAVILAFSKHCFIIGLIYVKNVKNCFYNDTDASPYYQAIKRH